MLLTRSLKFTQRLVLPKVSFRTFHASFKHRISDEEVQRRYLEVERDKNDVSNLIKQLQEPEVEKLESIGNRIELSVKIATELSNLIKNDYKKSANKGNKRQVIKQLKADLSVMHSYKGEVNKFLHELTESPDAKSKAIAAMQKAHDFDPSNHDIVLQLSSYLFENRIEEREHVYSAFSYVEKTINDVESDFDPEADYGKLYALRGKINMDSYFRSYVPAHKDLTMAIEYAKKFDYPYKIRSMYHLDRAKCMIDQIIYPEDEEEVQIQDSQIKDIRRDIDKAIKFFPKNILTQLVLEKFYRYIQIDIKQADITRAFLQENVQSVVEESDNDLTYAPYVQSLFSGKTPAEEQPPKVEPMNNQEEEDDDVQDNTPAKNRNFLKEKASMFLDDMEYGDEDEFFGDFDRDNFWEIMGRKGGMHATSKNAAQASIAAYEAGDYKEAITQINKAIKSNSDESNYYHHRSVIHFNILIKMLEHDIDMDLTSHASSDQLRFDCRKLEELDPNSFLAAQVAGRYRGVVHKDYKTALRHYQRAIKLAEDDEHCDDDYRDSLKEEMEMMKQLKKKRL
ncbi:stress-induced-phosphoprotein [Acrasis kona]|uniref:Stress-induced-phosphoprotein n=1 Tax=Acrasis kona TaxID=1008807 RepID=A0AAW2YYE4_9EUKA